MKLYSYIITSFFDLLIFSQSLFAQEKEAQLKISYSSEDSINICKVVVTSGDTPVNEITVNLYVKRLFSLLPIGDASTDEEGIATFEFPNDIPGDEEGKLSVIAKIEDDEVYTNTEAISDVKWGLLKTGSKKMERSLSASRARAPIYFIIIANLIIAGIWGTLIYVVLQLFKIKKLGRHLTKK